MESQSLARIFKKRNRNASFRLIVSCGILYLLIQGILFRRESQHTVQNLNHWLISNKTRLSKALYFNNQADVKMLLGDLKEKNTQNERVLELKIFNKKGVELQSDLSKSILTSAPSRIPGPWNGLITQEAELKFGGNKVGSVLIRSQYRGTKLLKHSLYALSFCALLAFFLSLIVNRLMKTVDDSVLKPILNLNHQISAPLNAVQNLHSISLPSHSAQAIPKEISQFVIDYNLQVEQIKDLNSAELKNKETEALMRLADQVAHDIRSPLTALNLVMDDLSLPTTHESILRGSIARINEIANSLLDARRVESTALQTIHPILSQISAELKTRFPDDSRLHIESVPTDEKLLTQIPRDLLARALSNLMNNAVEAMPEGGKISLKCETEEGIPVITLSDTGKGVPPEILSKLGTHGYSFGKNSGNGLGIWSAKECLEEYGGAIEIKSAIGQGTEVRLYV